MPPPGLIGTPASIGGYRPAAATDATELEPLDSRDFRHHTHGCGNSSFCITACIAALGQTAATDFAALGRPANHNPPDRIGRERKWSGTAGGTFAFDGMMLCIPSVPSVVTTSAWVSPG